MAETLPVVREQHTGVTAEWDPNPFQQKRYLFTSIDPESNGGKLLIARCARTATLVTDDMLNRDFAIRHVLCHVVELSGDEPGETVQAIRTVLVLDDSRTLAFVSQGIFQSLSWLGYTYGEPPWDPPIKVRLVRQQTRKKRATLLLEPVDPARTD